MQLVLVEWVDSWGREPWTDLDQLAKQCEPVHCRTVGWIVSKSNGATMLVSSISGEANENTKISATGLMTIPTKAVVKVSDLFPASAKRPIARRRRKVRRATSTKTT